MFNNTYRKLTYPFLITLSFLLWVYLFRGYLTNDLGMYPDGSAYYHMVKYYLDAIMRGVYPMWAPLKGWGVTDGVNLRFIGEFNPFLIIPAFFYKLTQDFNKVYFLYAVTYYFIGMIGFYLLAKCFFNDKRFAFISYMINLFSTYDCNISESIFLNILTIHEGPSYLYILSIAPSCITPLG